MKTFILKLCLFFFIAFCIDYTIGYLSYYFQINSKGGTTHKDNYIQNILSEDIIVMGSSRAFHHYIPKMISDSLGKSVYNTGMDGKGIILNYGLLLEILRRVNPEIIIYEITPDYDWIKGDNEKYLSHLRLAYDIPGIDSIFWDVNESERLKMLSKSYRSNSLIPHLIYDNIIAQKDSMNGYEPLYGVYEPKDEEKELQACYDIDPLKEKYLIRFILLCKKNNIDLIFAISPDLHNDSPFYNYGRILAKKYNLKIIDSYESYEFYNSNIYQDATHLNDKGARMYTEWVISLLDKMNY